ncbi:MAG: hypothetical protein VX223_10485 [Myxococcota bacterium]|nr:hypothetical protein [Myxococcota bacterium]
MELNDAPRKDGRRRRRPRRRGRGGRGGGNQNQQSQHLDPNDERLRPRRGHTPSGPETLNQFTLFCAYHLGITRDDGYKFQSIGEVARRFNVDVAVIKAKLAQYHIETEELRTLGFESEYAHLDIKVAPEGVSRRALAQTMFDELNVAAPEPDPEPVEEEAAEEEAAEEEAAEEEPEMALEAEEAEGTSEDE